MVLYMRKYYVKKTLSPSFFALIISGGISGTIIVLYFTAIFVNNVKLDVKIISIGSLMAVLKRTMDSAPTMPNDSTTLDVTAIMTRVATKVSPIKVSANPVEYMTPVKVLL